MNSVKSYTSPVRLSTLSPPSYFADLLSITGLSEGHLRLLRRGATMDMIHIYSMEYDHRVGIIAKSGTDTLHLGWNINLSEDDEDGSDYIDDVYQDLQLSPMRWDISYLQDGSRVCSLQVRNRDSFDYDSMADSDDY